MRKLIGGILASVMLFTAGVMVGCGSSETTRESAHESAHEHAYVEKTIAATCTQEGYNQFVCECGDSYKGETVLPKTAHTGMGSCLICGLNYYEELTNLIKSNGIISNNSIYLYVGKTRTDSETEQSTYVSFDPGTFTISVRLSVEYSPNMTADFIFFIKHPSEDSGIQTGKYTWSCRTTYKNYEMYASGILNGAVFSSYTTTLTVTSGDSSMGGLAGDYAKYVMTDALIPLLKLGKNGVTPANLGFENFSL